MLDERTGKAFYKQLTQKELCNIIGTWQKMQWE